MDKLTLPKRAALAANLHSLERALAGRKFSDGLGGALTGHDSQFLRHAQPALQALDRWLSRTAAPVPAGIVALLGLGPGLTPSGDDYLAGALVALRAMGMDASADALWAGLRDAVDGRTHAISRAHLFAAAAGRTHEALHLCLAQLLEDGDAEWSVALARVDAVGHCSGWDGLAGVVAVARSALQ